MVQTAVGAKHNYWISFMKSCSAEYKRQKAEAKASAEGVKSQRGKAKRGARACKHQAELQKPKDNEKASQQGSVTSQNHNTKEESQESQES